MIDKITPIRLEWNNMNGFMFSILDIECGRFESELFGIHMGWKSYFIIYLFFIQIEIKKPWYGR